MYEALAHCRLFLVIGVSGGSEPAKSFLAEAHRAGARAVGFPGELNPDPPPNAEPFDERIPGPLADTLPAYVKRLIAG